MRNITWDMKLMQFLLFSKEYFISLSFFQKFEVYFISSCLVFSLFYFNNESVKITTVKYVKTQNISSINIMHILEEKLKSYKINVKKFDFLSSSFNYELEGTYLNLLNFLHYSQTITSKVEIEYLELFYEKEKKKFKMHLIISFNSIKKENENLSKLKFVDVFKKNKYKKTLKLEAIVGRYIVINKKIYYLNDTISSYVIKEIAPSLVRLKNKNGEKILRINDYVRN